MQITWHGYNCLTIKGNEIAVVTDPYFFTKPPVLKADIVTVSNSKKYGNVSTIIGNPTILDWPGEYEIKDVFFKTVENEKDLSQELKCLIFTIDIDDIRICHLSDLKETLADELLEEIGTIDILFVPVGGNSTLNSKKAHDVIEQIEPKIVIPMHYRFIEEDKEITSIDEFLKEIGEREITPVDTYKIVKSKLPQDKTEYIILNPQI